MEADIFSVSGTQVLNDKLDLSFGKLHILVNNSVFAKL